MWGVVLFYLFDLWNNLFYNNRPNDTLRRFHAQYLAWLWCVPSPNNPLALSKVGCGLPRRNSAWWRRNSATLHFSHNFQKIIVSIKYLFYIPHFVIFAQKRSGNRIFVHCFTSFNCTYTKAPTTQDISPITSL